MLHNHFPDHPTTTLQPRLNHARQICRASKSFASEVKSDSGEIAANAIKRSPEIGGFAVGVVENYGCGVELLRETSGASETQTLSLRPSRDPCKCKVGDKMIVAV